MCLYMAGEVDDTIASTEDSTVENTSLTDQIMSDLFENLCEDQATVCDLGEKDDVETKEG